MALSLKGPMSSSTMNKKKTIPNITVKIMTPQDKRKFLKASRETN